MNLTIKNLSFERNDQFIFENVNFELNSGDLLHVRGENGSGKTTLLRIVSGLIEPSNGHVLWNDQCIFSQREQYLQQLHYLGHKNGIKPSLTLLENLHISKTLFSSNSNSNDRQSMLQLLKLWQLANRQARHLSAGQLRRLSLARLALNQSSIWILDEPTTSLDSDGQKILIQLLNQHLRKGGIAIIAMHQNLNLAHNVKMIQLGERL